ncbi:MAG: Ig-like domain-containing protein [Verrucomicrobiota bacterium]
MQIRFISATVTVLALTTIPAFGQQPTITETRDVATRSAVVNFSELAATSVTGKTRARKPLPDFKRGTSAGSASLFTGAIESPLGPSPAAVQSFGALVDDGRFVPPDTMGAVGPNHIMTALNSQIRIQNRTGGVISTADMSAFWNSVGAVDVFDPHVTFEAGMQRWIFSATADDGSSSAVLVGVSATSDPTLDWYLYSVDADPANLVSADYDAVGYNDKWIVVTANMFRISNNGFDGVRFYVFSKTDLATNGPGTVVRFESRNDNAFSVIPALTQDAGVDTLYMVEDWDGSAGQLRISTITGPVGSEVLTIGTALPTTANRWALFANSENPAPQLGSTHGIDTGDSRVMNCLYRNGSIWVAQTAFLPQNNPTRSSAQWWQVQVDGTVQQFGRVDDPTGNIFYAYPTVAVNASNDVLIGYSRFAATQYPSANYAFRFGSDPLNRLRSDTVLKAGSSSYYSPASGLNRWGDYSATCVDPVDDYSLWTIQEYAAAGNLWGTWWARVNPDLALLKLALTRPSDGMTYPLNPVIRLEVTPLDLNVTYTNMEFYADNIKIGATNAAPFRIEWSGAASGGHDLSAIGTDNLGGKATSTVVTVTVGDLSSPVGTWETKLSGAAKGTVILAFNDDFTLTGHGMEAGSIGLFLVSGAWSYNAAHQPTGTLSGLPQSTGDFTAKIKGSKLSATAGKLKFKGQPLLPVLDLAGAWSASVAGSPATWQLALSPVYANVFDWIVTGPSAASGSMLITAKGAINASLTNAPQWSLTGKSKDGLTMSLKGSVSIQATKP